MIFGGVAVVACLLLAAMFMYFRIVEKGPMAVVVKTMASVVFVLAGVYLASTAKFNGPAVMMIPVGLMCGLIGDVLLELKVVYSVDKRVYYYGGVIAFMLGHFFYAGAMCSMIDPGVKVLKALCAAIAIGLAISTIIMLFGDKLNLNFGEYFWITYAYSFVLISVAALSVWFAICDTRFIMLAVGMVAFLASDLVLSMQYFGAKQLENKASLVIINHSLYYVAQLLVMFSLVLF